MAKINEPMEKSLEERTQVFCKGCECHNPYQHYPGACSEHEPYAQMASAARNYCVRTVDGKKVTWSKDSPIVGIEFYDDVAIERVPLVDPFGLQNFRSYTAEAYDDVVIDRVQR